MHIIHIFPAHHLSELSWTLESVDHSVFGTEREGLYVQPAAKSKSMEDDQAKNINISLSLSISEVEITGS